jgi:hypothetical protein
MEFEEVRQWMSLEYLSRLNNEWMQGIETMDKFKEVGVWMNLEELDNLWIMQGCTMNNLWKLDDLVEWNDGWAFKSWTIQGNWAMDTPRN